MFRDNMIILFLALLTLMFIALAVVAVFEDALLKDFESMDNAKLDENVTSIMQIMEQESTTNWDALEQKLEEYDYELLVLKNGTMVYGNFGEEQEELLQSFDEETDIGTGSGVELFYHKKTTIVGKYIQDSGEYAMAVHFLGEKWWLSSFRHSFSVFFIVFIIIGVAAIGVILIFSSFFTKILRDRIMEPLEALIEGAKRIQNGNLKEEIYYRGDEEFENVCNTFNAMQRTMLEDGKRRRKDEKARTDMVTGISHDLRTPLTSIQGYIKGILDGVADTEEKKQIYLQTAYEATKEMNILLQKLFDFSRLESGQMPFHKIKGDLAEFTAAYVAQKELVIDSNRVNISLTKEAEVLPEIYMDIEQIKRIFDNLLENSMKYVNADPIKIRIYIYEEGSYVVLRWKDNGDGVPEEKLGNIFEKFYRCDEARTKKGSGVGLYVVKYIVEQHGGKVTAKNENGLMFQLYFPKGD